MSETRLTIVIPVGPEKRHAQWLDQVITSADAQTIPVDILIVDDMNGLTSMGALWHESDVITREGLPNLRIYHPPWRLGVAHAFNFGVALAGTEVCLLLGADDWLEPDAAEIALRDYNSYPGDPGNLYWYLPLRYEDTGEVQHVPCGAAVVSKTLWRRTGGFPPESAVGASDTILGSIILHQHRDKGSPLGFGAIGSWDHPLYHYRRHPGTDTAEKAAWQGGIIPEVRGRLTEEWKPPEWGRYE